MRVLPADDFFAYKIRLNLPPQRRPAFVRERQRCQAAMRFDRRMKMPNHHVSRLFSIGLTKQKSAAKNQAHALSFIATTPKGILHDLKLAVSQLEKRIATLTRTRDERDHQAS